MRRILLPNADGPAVMGPVTRGARYPLRTTSRPGSSVPTYGPARRNTNRLRAPELIAKPESLRKFLLVLIKVNQVRVIFSILSSDRCASRDAPLLMIAIVPATCHTLASNQGSRSTDKQHQGRKQSEILQQYECQVGGRRSCFSGEGYGS